MDIKDKYKTEASHYRMNRQFCLATGNSQNAPETIMGRGAAESYNFEANTAQIHVFC
jgi:hypothetical protein